MKNLELQKLPYITTEMANEDYHHGFWQREFISSTTLKNYLVSPKYFKHCLTSPKQISLSSAIQGSVYHSMLESICKTGCLEGVYDEFFVFEAPINPKTGEPYGATTKAYKEEYQLQIENSGGKTPCSQEEIETAKRMITELLGNCGQTSDIVNYLLQIGTPEVSFFTEYEGCKFKFRTDLKTRNKIVDWKSCALDDLHPDTIAKQISKMNYGFSAAFYQFFNHQITGEWNEFLWVFQQKSAPYDAVIVSAGDWAYQVDWDGQVIKGPSAIEFENILAKHIECAKEDYYPGAESMIIPTNGYRIMYSTLPNYKRNSVINFY